MDESGTVDMREYLSAASFVGMTVWISRRDDADVDAEVANSKRAGGALAGVRLAVKDNVDADGLPTTAACPEFGYRPDRDAAAVAALRAAGAVVVGKTNLDQFATGLVGTRSPYGVVPDSRRPDFISGGSSSGSAVAVATGRSRHRHRHRHRRIGPGARRTAGHRRHQTHARRRQHRRRRPCVRIL